MSQSVRAAVMTGPGRLEVRQFPRPDLSDGGALMRVEACGICHGCRHRYPLERAEDAVETAARGDSLKVVLVP